MCMHKLNVIKTRQRQARKDSKAGKERLKGRQRKTHRHAKKDSKTGRERLKDRQGTIQNKAGKERL